MKAVTEEGSDKIGNDESTTRATHEMKADEENANHQDTDAIPSSSGDSSPHSKCHNLVSQSTTNSQFHPPDSHQ